MCAKAIVGGVVHGVPHDVGDVFITSSSLMKQWESLTPLARNEWLCWIEEAKRLDTRVKRIKRMKEELREGARRPCCWAGCPHRKK